MEVGKELAVFKFEGTHEVRTVVQNGEPWFVAKDVCEILELDNVTRALSTLDDDERGSLTISKGTSPMGGNPNVNIINESGLYALIFKSRKSQAHAFRKWVTSEVLPRFGKLVGTSPPLRKTPQK